MCDPCEKTCFRECDPNHVRKDPAWLTAEHVPNCLTDDPDTTPDPTQLTTLADPAQIVLAAESLVKQNHFKDAVQLYDDWLSKALRRSLKTTRHNGSIAVAYNNRGHLKYLMVDFDGAVLDYNLALHYDPLLPSTYYNRGTIMYRMGNFEKAVQDMLIAARLAPECVDFNLALTRCADQLVKIFGVNLPPPRKPGDLTDEGGEFDETTGKRKKRKKGKKGKKKEDDDEHVKFDTDENKLGSDEVKAETEEAEPKPKKKKKKDKSEKGEKKKKDKSEKGEKKKKKDKSEEGEEKKEKSEKGKKKKDKSKKGEKKAKPETGEEKVKSEKGEKKKAKAEKGEKKKAKAEKAEKKKVRKDKVKKDKAKKAKKPAQST